MWVPLYVHLSDTAFIAAKLWDDCVISDSIKKIIQKNTIIEGREVTLPEVRTLFIAVAALHDIGKATPYFQTAGLPDRTQAALTSHFQQKDVVVPTQKEMEWLNAYKDVTAVSRHESAACAILSSVGCPPPIMAVISAHHGTTPSTSAKDAQDSFPLAYHLDDRGKKRWQQVQNELIRYALSFVGVDDIKDLPIPGVKAQVMLAGYTIIADWIASSEDNFPLFVLGEEADLTPDTLRLRGEKGWRSLDLPPSTTIGSGWRNNDYFKQRYGFTPNELQTAAMDIAKNLAKAGIVIIEAPMGHGKTEAALACAEIIANRTNRSGVYFGLPTQATADGLLPRLIDWARKINTTTKTLNLAHGKAQYNDDYQELAVNRKPHQSQQSHLYTHPWYAGRHKVMLADVVAGTVDQFLVSALNQKHVVMRHIGLAGKVVIIDECHAYDAYMNEYLKRALAIMGEYGVPVIVLSATLPNKTRQTLIKAYIGKDTQEKQVDPFAPQRETDPPEHWEANQQYPVITYSDNNQVHQKCPVANPRSTKVAIKHTATVNIVKLLESQLIDGGCVGIIVNTVERAQQMYHLLASEYKSQSVSLVHARYLSPDRTQQEARIMRLMGKDKSRRPALHIVIGTQVLEQSLDIDFDLILSDPCPIDLLLQRIGRLHRHTSYRPKKLKEAVCYILTDDNGEAADLANLIYGEYLLLKTMEHLPTVITLPDDIAPLVQMVYDDESSPTVSEKIRTAKREWKKALEKKRSKAGAFLLKNIAEIENNTISGWLGDVASPQEGEAAVRDIDESIEVVLLQRKKTGALSLMSWLESEELPPTTSTLDNRTARKIAQQTIRLPRKLCNEKRIKKTLEQLTERSKEFAEWQKSAWLEDELFLTLDETNLSTILNGYVLQYTREEGLKCQREEE